MSKINICLLGRSFSSLLLSFVSMVGSVLGRSSLVKLGLRDRAVPYRACGGNWNYAIAVALKL